MICRCGDRRTVARTSRPPVTEYQMSSLLGLCRGQVKYQLLRVNGQVVWAACLDRRTVTESGSGYAGLSGSGGSYTTNSGQITDHETVYFDLPGLFGGRDGKGGVRGNVEFYVGSNPQTFSQTVASTVFQSTPGNIPGYHDLAMLYFDKFVWQIIPKDQQNPDKVIVEAAVTRCPVVLNGTNAEITAPGTIRYQSDRDTGDAFDDTVDVDCTRPPDANPAYVLYELLTDKEFGMGEPTDDVDEDSFNAAAATLQSEGLGISFVWDRQRRCEDVIKDIIEVIQGVMVIDPVQGKWVLKLLRSDYASDDPNIRTITPDTAIMQTYTRKACSKQINEISVLWTDPADGKLKTTNAQDLAAMNTTGKAVSETRNYYMISNEFTAYKLALRDLRQTTWMQRQATMVLDRSFWGVRPGDVLRLTWPDYKIENLMMRVTQVDYGSPGKMGITVTMVEDIYNLSPPHVVSLPYTPWDSVRTSPTPMDQTFIMTAPRVVMEASEDNDPDTYLAILARDSAPDCTGFVLAREVPLQSGGTEWTEEGSFSLADRGITGAALVREPETQIATDSLISTFEGQYGPALGDWVIIGDSEANHEIAVITGYDSGTDTITLLRGAHDTLPGDWPAGTPVWLINEYVIFLGTVPHPYGVATNYKLKTRTGLGVLDEAQATVVSFTPTERPYQPIRPANMAIDGTAWPATASHSGSSDVVVTWANRNRLTEDDSPAWDGPTETPETGQETKVEILDDNDAVIQTYTAPGGDTSINIPATDFGTAPVSRKVRLTAVRDGFQSRVSVIQQIDLT